MSEQKEQVEQWLQKLQRESWQLELLVSAFTIFLLIQANISFRDFYSSLPFIYNINDSFLAFIYLFIGIIGLAVKALTVFLIIHLLLRGFWIGAIGLRSVQDKIDFSKLNYSPHFTDLLRGKVMSLDKLVTVIDEICSVIFSFSFLAIWMLLSFGLYLLFVGIVGFFIVLLNQWLGDFWILNTIFSILSLVVIGVILLTGIIYLIDFLTLGFFKKFNQISKPYSYIYRFYGWITWSSFSNSIYYYLISKFSKRRIRIVYLIIILVLGFNLIWEYDQYVYFPGSNNEYSIRTNYYDDIRPEEDYIAKVSIQSKVVSDPFLELFIRYNPEDNTTISQICPEHPPIKNDGINPNFEVNIQKQGIQIQGLQYSDEDVENLLGCLQDLFSISINGNPVNSESFFYHVHPIKRQKGIMTLIPIKGLNSGQNELRIRKKGLTDDGEIVINDYAYVPFWTGG